jgi:hypothetical protein
MCRRLAVTAAHTQAAHELQSQRTEVLLSDILTALQRAPPPFVDSERAVAKEDEEPENWSLASHIAALVQQLELPDSSREDREDAASELGQLAFLHALNQTAIGAAGAIPALVLLLGPGTSAGVQHHAAEALDDLAFNHAQVCPSHTHTLRTHTHLFPPLPHSHP